MAPARIDQGITPELMPVHSRREKRLARTSRGKKTGSMRRERKEGDGKRWKRKRARAGIPREPKEAARAMETEKKRKARKRAVPDSALPDKTP
jgi:hypothetical protein